MAENRGLFRLKIGSQFSSSHQLRNYGGKCESMHGHNFQVEAEVEGEHLDPKTHILVDFKELKAVLNEIVDGLDHRHLNELAPFEEHNPSSENLARYIYTELQKGLQDRPVWVHQVTVAEKEGSEASYREVRSI